MRSRALLALCFVGVLTASAKAQDLPIRLSLQVLNSETARATVSRASVALPSGAIPFKRVGGMLAFSDTVSFSDLSGRLQVIIEDAQISRREVVLRMAPLESEGVTRTLKVYVVDLSAEVPFQDIDGAREWLDDGESDRALALLEHGWELVRNPGDSNEYVLSLRYNLARALQQNCLRKGQDTCDRARSRLTSIMDQYDTHKRMLTRMGVTRALIGKALLDLNQFEENEAVERLRIEFSRVSRDFLTGGDRYRAAAEGLENFIENYEENRDRWKRIDKRLFDFERDAGLSWLGYANHQRRTGTTTDIERSYRAALKWLESALDLRHDENIEAGIAEAKSALRAIANQQL